MKFDSAIRAWHLPKDPFVNAVATVHKVQYSLTWNCKHLANAQIAKRVSNLCRLAGYEMPTVCTPEELLEEPSNEE